MRKSFPFTSSILCVLLLVSGEVSRAEPPRETPFNPFSGKHQTFRLPADGLIMVESGGKTYFTTPNARFIIRGQMYDVWNGEIVDTVEEAKRLSERIHLEKFKMDIDRDLEPFYLGDGEKEVVVFIDPNCPYCHKLMRQMADLKGYRFKLILIPALGDRSAKTIRLLRCGTPEKNRNAIVVRRLLERDYSGLEDKRCDLSPFLKSAVLAKILGINGVPFLIAPDGRVLKGYVDDLKSWLEAGNG